MPSLRIRHLVGAAGLAAVAALAGVTACSPRDGAGPPTSAHDVADIPDEPASISGVVTAIGDDGRVRIEEHPDDHSGYEKAVARIDAARIVRRSGAPATAADVAVGQHVSAWFTGPVMESYPVQATASVVVIEAEAQ
jgi:hypothetical protein